MRYLDVLLDIPTLTPAPIYTYCYDPDDGRELNIGVPVLAELGTKLVEGWVVRTMDCPPPGIVPRRLVKILDQGLFLPPSLWRLAQWISDTYVCPMNLVFKALLPPRPPAGKARLITAGVDPDDKQFSPETRKFLAIADHEGGLSWEQALQHLDLKTLLELEAEGFIIDKPARPRSGKEKGLYRYRLDNYGQDILAGLHRAPRQREVLEYLQENETGESGLLEKRFGLSLLERLIRKGILRRETVPKIIAEPQFSLTSGQRLVLEKLKNLLFSGFKEALLYGVTGSGKTEIYLRLAQMVIKAGKGVIILVPEIALTRHLTEILKERIPNLAVLHSRLAAGERRNQWSAIARGEIDLVLGTRLAVFAPLPNPGLIIVDEEQESSFKQEESPRYHAREAARKRAELEGAALLLGSATPSMESYHRALSGQTVLLTLAERPGHSALPFIEIEDMRKHYLSPTKGALSLRLREGIKENLERERQSILFINRRGHTPLTMCLSCGRTLQCPNCSVALTYHRQNDSSLCHYCGFTQAPPRSCPDCGSRYLQPRGSGTQRVEEEINQEFPQARTARLDLDNSSSGKQEDILHRMQRGDIDILIGTQMVAKGLHFPDVSLVGIVDADSMLNLPDFRAAERGFQLMVQAAGRAGRGEVAGKVLVQTFHPENSIIQQAAAQDYEGFYQEELRWREMLDYPPFTHILRLVASDNSEKDAQKLAEMLARRIEEATDALEQAPTVLGPAPCPLNRIRQRFRFQILVKSDNILLLSSIGRYIMNRERTTSGRVELDIDPLVTM